MSTNRLHILNGPPPSRPGVWLSVKCQSSNEPAEILITGQIGKDWWSDDGVAEKEFKDALAAIPDDREIIVGINSEGGEIKAGLGIYNALQQRKNKVTVRVDGYAVSIASIIALAGKRTVSPRSSIWMIHEPWTFASGNAEDFSRAADMLEQHAEMLVDIYAEHTGKTRDAIRAAMKKETWLRGTEAMDFGLCDECPEETHEPKASFDLTRFKNVPDYVKNFAAPRNGTQPNKPAADSGSQENHMDRTEIIAALRARGDEVDESLSTDALKAQILAPLKPKARQEKKNETETDNSDVKAVIVDLRAELKAAKEAREKAEKAQNETNKKRIRAEVQKFADEGRIDGNAVDGWTELAITNDKAEASVLKQLSELPVKAIGAEPVVVTESASPQDCLSGFGKFQESVKAWQRGSAVEMKVLGADALAKAHFLAKNRDKLATVMNTNTVPTELKRSFILGDRMRDFKRRLLMLSMFSTVYQNVPLEGTDKVEVPFYDLDTSSAVSFVSGTGYTTIGDTTTAVREIQIGEATQPANRDRKFIGLGFTSQEIARQPYLVISQLAGLKLERLADLVLQHVLSLITAANYGAPAITRALNAMNSDDLADIKLACKLWPSEGRGLILDSGYDASLLKDTSFKHALNAASDSAIKEGRLNPRVFGFDYVENPTIPSNSENLAGFAFFKSAILVATAPVPPVEEVRRSGTSYEIVTDPDSGISFEYRTFGNNTTDAATHVAEVSYGFAKGNATALKRIVTP